MIPYNKDVIPFGITSSQNQIPVNHKYRRASQLLLLKQQVHHQ